MGFLGHDPGLIGHDHRNAHEPLESRNKSPLYDASLVQELADRLLDAPSIYESFYKPIEIDDLCKKWTLNP